MTEAAGIPTAVAIAGANRHDSKLLEATIDSLAIERPDPADTGPQGVCLDKAYDSDAIRQILDDRGFVSHIRSRGEEADDLRDDPTRRARRWVVERTHSWINRYRALLIRWSKKTENHQALLLFCFAIITWQQLGLMDTINQISG
jgi:IS5 family transposase